MVKAIDFVVRDSAGAVVRGSVAGNGSNVVQLGTGEDISLNLARQSVTAFQQRGSDLVVTLVDGREIVLAGYFNQNGEPNQLYLSQNGEVVAVELSNAGNGHLMASYGPTDGWDKFSTLDALRFGNGDDLALAQGAISDDPAGMAAFVPGLLGLGGGAAALAGLGVAAAVIGGGGSGGGDGGNNGGTPGRAQPTVDEPDSKHVVTTNTDDKTLEVSGTGEPGDKVTVIIGDKEQETVIDEDGKWKVEFDENELPDDGTYETEVVFKQPDGTETTLDGPTFVLDLTPPDVAVTEGARSNNHVENLDAYADGVTIGGTGEIGAKIEVTVGGVTKYTFVDESGKWSVNYSQSEVAGGERSEQITVTATDALGNRTVISDWLDIDTIPNPISFDKVTADNTVNSFESAAGFQISGTSVAGAVLTVTIPNGAQAVTQTVTADQNGNWSFTFPAGVLVGGERDATITATSTDTAGNVTNTAYSFKVDTLVNPLTTQSGAIAGDGVINAAEAAAGVAIGGKVEAGAQSVIVTLSNGKILQAEVSGDTWTAHLSASDLSEGNLTYTVQAVDAAGNVGIIGDNGGLGFTVDTVAPVGLEVINISKSNSVANTLELVKVSGLTEEVSLHRIDATGNAADVAYTKDGSWLDFSGHGVPDGSYLVIQNADAAGNSTSTLLVVNNTNAGTIDLSREGLDGFDLGIIDLLSAPQANLTITSADLQRLTGVDQTLVIRGGADDHVTLDGAIRHEAADTTGYLAYQLGGGIVLIDDDISNVNTII